MKTRICRASDRVRITGKVFEDGIFKDGTVISVVAPRRYKVKLDRGDLVYISLQYIVRKLA